MARQDAGHSRSERPYQNWAIFFPYGESPIDTNASLKESNELSINEDIKEKNDNLNWQNYANIYWLGHDLMYTMDVLLRGGSKKEIDWGLGQSLHHARSFGLNGTSVENELTQFHDNAMKMRDEDWTHEKRIQLVSNLARIRNEIGALINVKQKDYKRTPDD